MTTIEHRVDRYFSGIAYSDPDSVSGPMLLAARVRFKAGIDSSGTEWSLLDALLSGETPEGAEINARQITLARKFGGLTIFFEYAFGEDNNVGVSLDGDATHLLEGLDLPREFAQGLDFLIDGIDPADV